MTLSSPGRAFLFLALMGSPSLWAKSPLPDTLLFEDFESYTEKGYPRGWKARGWQHKANHVYTIRLENGNKFLNAHDKGEDVQIGKEESWNPETYPILSFRWRAKVLPKGASENNTKTNDSAAGIYIIFKGGLLYPPGIKYVWSSALPASDTNVSYKKKLICIVLQSGTKNLNRWVTHEVNYLEHYKKYFQTDSVPGIRGIGILTDANATNSTAEADYDQFMLRKAFSKPPPPNAPGLEIAN